MGKKQSFESYEDFLSALAFKVNHMDSGGIPHLMRSAQLMVKDWNSGKIPFYVAPPQIIETNTEIKFVDGGFSKEFDINQYLESNHREAEMMSKKCGKHKDGAYLKVDADKFVVVDEEEQEMDDGEYEVDEDGDMGIDNN